MSTQTPPFRPGSTVKEPWRLAQNVLVLSSAEVVNKLLVILFYIFAARHLGAAGFGIFSAALAITVIFANFADLGISYLIAREVSRDYSQASRYISDITTFKFVVFLIIFGIQLGTIKVLNYSNDVVKAVLILSLFILFSSLTVSFNSIFQAFERMIFIAVGKCLGSLVLFIGSLLLTLSSADVSRYCILYVIAFFLTALYGFLVLRTKFVVFRFSWEFSLLRKIFKKAVPFGLISIFVPFYYWSGTAFLSLIKGDIEVGLYNASAHLVSGLAFLGSAFLSAIYPLMSREAVNSQGSIRSLLERSFKYMILLAMPLCFFVIISRERIITTFFGHAYIQSIPILSILIWWGFFIYMNGVWANFFYSIDKQSIIMRQSLAALILNLGLNIVLTPKFGVFGTSVAIVSAEIFSFVYLTRQFIVFGYRISLREIGKTVVKVVGAAVLATFLIFMLRDKPFFVITSVYFVSYLAICYYLRVFGLRDLQLFKNAIEFLLKRKA